MRILLTGSEGALGQPLKAKLREQGHDVYGCDLAHTDDPQVIRADVAERRQLRRAYDFSRPDLVYHLAAEFGRNNGKDYYEQLWKSNCIGTRNVIEETLRTESTMAFASSSEAYGMADEYMPDKNAAFEEGLLDHYPPFFHNEYALSKWTNERQIYTAARNDGLKAVVFRFFNVYGPGEHFSPYRSVVCQFVYKLLKGDPITVYRDSYRSHLFIDDWCRGVSALVKSPLLYNVTQGNNSREFPGSGKTKVPVFNIGSPDYESAQETLARIQKQVGPFSESVITVLDAEAGNISSKRANIVQAQAWFGFEPKVSIEEGIMKTVKWMRETYGF